MIVALLTDFGSRDHYVGTMKGVILSVCPRAALVDITHDIPPQDIATAAWELDASYRYFPSGTVFLAVVDPGVGSARRGIAAEAGGYRFVGPDNGVFSFVFAELPPRVVELTERRFARAAVSRTFEGRDRFAPAAGWLACGTDLAALGPAISDPVVFERRTASVVDGVVSGEVTRADRFGNLITNIGVDLLRTLRRPAAVDICGQHIPDVIATYAEASAGSLCALVGSAGYLEVAVANGNAAERLGAGRGQPVRVTGAAA